MIRANLGGNVHLVEYAPGKLVYRPGPNAPSTLAADLRQRLDSWTGHAWTIEEVEDAEGAPSLQQQRAEAAAVEREDAIAHPAVQSALKAFPGAKVEDVRTVQTTTILGEEPVDPEAESDNGDERS